MGSTSTNVGTSQAFQFGTKGSLGGSEFNQFNVINSPNNKKDEANGKNNKAEKRLLDGSKVKDMASMNSSSDLDKDRDGFSTHASEAKEKISS